MYNQPYFIPSYYGNMAAPSMAAPNMMRGAMGGAMMGARGASRGMGLFGRIGSGIASLRSLNWGGFINNASKTLGVINQTIPLVRQAGPMFHNMKSMLRVASIFKDETDRKPSSRKKDTVSTSSRQNNSATNGTFHEHSTPASNQKQSSTFYSSNQVHPYSHFASESSSKQEYELGSSSEENEGSPTFFIQ